MIYRFHACKIYGFKELGVLGCSHEGKAALSVKKFIRFRITVLAIAIIRLNLWVGRGRPTFVNAMSSSIDRALYIYVRFSCARIRCEIPPVMI